MKNSAAFRGCSQRVTAVYGKTGPVLMHPHQPVVFVQSALDPSVMTAVDRVDNPCSSSAGRAKSFCAQGAVKEIGKIC